MVMIPPSAALPPVPLSPQCPPQPPPSRARSPSKSRGEPQCPTVPVMDQLDSVTAELANRILHERKLRDAIRELQNTVTHLRSEITYFRMENDSLQAQVHFYREQNESFFEILKLDDKKMS